MSALSRRQALTGGTAIAALATVSALPVTAGDPDAELFAAIARWREVRDTYDAESDRQNAILAQVDAEMPEYCIRQTAAIAALHASCAGELTAAKKKHYYDLDAALRPFREAHTRRATELGYDEDEASRLSSISWDVCHDAMAVPARTLAGLGTKLEMLLIEHSETESCLRPEREDYGPNLNADQWRYLVADIRRLAGEAPS